MNHIRAIGYVLGCLLLLTTCTAPASLPKTTPPTLSGAMLVPVQHAWQRPLAPPNACSNRFVAHDLSFQLNTSTPVVHLFESNGAGVAVGDLDNDGWLDLVFANLAGPSRILWNQGGLQFAYQDLEARNTRAVAIIDQDGDGRLDIAFTQRGAGVSLWHNQGQRQFIQTRLQGVQATAYSMAWADLSGHGMLDLITGSYDAERAIENPNSMLDTSRNGVFVYRSTDLGYQETRLAEAAQALTIAPIDLNQDGQRDLVVGNDFGTPDAAWLQADGNWQAGQPFRTTSHSTMSLDWADIDNTGRWALFSTDMKPDTIDVQTLAAWLPMMQQMPQSHLPGDRQVMSNVLQVQQPDGSWNEQAADRGIDASGWSWAGLFGDLNNDGLQDALVVNGMAAHELFAHLPNNELIESNQAFQQMAGRFKRAPQWGLGSTRGGRGMMLADLDNDGDLDSVVSNLGASAQLFENQLCGGEGMEVDLRWPGTRNVYAIGATLTLYTNQGTFTRDVRATSGYLSGNAARVHFGFPQGTILERLDIAWPDGRISPIEGIVAQTRVEVVR